MKVPVFVMTANVKSAPAQLLAGHFDDDLFDVHIASIDTPRSLSPKAAEWRRVETLLNNAKDSQYGMVLVKDSTVTTVEPKLLARTIQAASERYDLFHLCRWNEDCMRVKNAVSIPNSSIAMISSMPPDGVQALYLSQKAVRALLEVREKQNDGAAESSTSLAQELRTLVAAGTLASGAPASNMFNFNILMADGAHDLRKTVECSIRDSPVKEEVEDVKEDFPVVVPAAAAAESEGLLAPLNPAYTLGFVKRGRVGWFFLLFIALVLLAILVVFFVMRQHNNSNNKHTEAEEDLMLLE